MSDFNYETTNVTKIADMQESTAVYEDPYLNDESKKCVTTFAYYPIVPFSDYPFDYAGKELVVRIIDDGYTSVFVGSVDGELRYMNLDNDDLGDVGYVQLGQELITIVTEPSTFKDTIAVEINLVEPV